MTRLLPALLLLSSVAFAAAEPAPYFITIDKLELKKASGEWVTIFEPDHRVDLRNAEAAVSFFNNGRVKPDRFNNFRVTFDDQGKKTEMSRKKDLEPPVEVKKGSFVGVSFDLDLDSKKVRETRLTVDGRELVDPGDNIEMKG